MGFLLTSGNFVITWEPGSQQKSKDDQNKQGIVFEKFADLLPEMVYEVDLTGKILYANKQGLNFFGYSKEDLEKGVNISEFFPESYKEMIENLKALTSPGQISSNEYFARKKDGTLSSDSHSFLCTVF